MSFNQIIAQYSEAMLGGLMVTLRLSVIVWAFGIILGSILGALGAQYRRVFGIPSKIVSVALAGIPVLVLLFWMHYPFQSFLGVIIEPFVTAALTLSIVNIALVADHIRVVIGDFPRQYLDAAKVCGVRRKDTIFRIQLPILMRQIIPGLLMIQVSVFQMTIFASLISVDEVFRVSQRINAQIYKPVEIYTMLALFFVVACVPLHLLAHWLKANFTRDYSER